MATAATAETRVLLQDAFTESQLSSGDWAFPTGDPSFLPPDTQQRAAFPGLSGGAAHLLLDTFNPTARVAGDSFLGTEILSQQTFSLGNGPVAFEARMRLPTNTGGLVAAMFAYNINNATGLHDELDYEILSNDIAAGRNRVQTNAFANQPLGTGNPLFVPDPDPSAYHTYRIEWFPSQVRFLIDGQVFRVDTTHVPQGGMAFHLNIWAPGSNWPDAFNPGLRPVASAAADTRFSFDVSYARVAQLAGTAGSVASYNVTSYGNGTDIKDSMSGAIVQSLPPLSTDTLQFITADGREYGRNLASAGDLGLDVSKLRDFDGNDLGSANGWQLSGLANVRALSSPSYILMNPMNDRWAEVAVRDDGNIDMNNFGRNGDTRVVGIYLDPLVAQGLVVKGGPIDSQVRFISDIHANRLAVLGGDDYEHDGFVDLFFKLTNHAADHHDDVYLRAIMHLDGNIQYANYMNAAQFQDWMTRSGVQQGVYADWMTRI